MTISDKALKTFVYPVKEINMLIQLIQLLPNENVLACNAPTIKYTHVIKFNKLMPVNIERNMIPAVMN